MVVTCAAVVAPAVVVPAVPVPAVVAPAVVTVPAVVAPVAGDAMRSLRVDQRPVAAGRSDRQAEDSRRCR